MPFTGKDVTFVEDPPAFRQEFRSFTGSVGRHISRLTIDTGFRARNEAPHPGKLGTGRTKINYSTGALAASIITTRAKTGPELDCEGRVVVLDPKAKYVIHGTSPHPIRARRAPRLVFFWARRGRVFAGKKVKHPGTPANDFLNRALRRTVR